MANRSSQQAPAPEQDAQRYCHIWCDSRDGTNYASALAQYLQGLGITVISDEMLSSRHFAIAIREYFSNIDFFIVLLTDKSRGSIWFRAELDLIASTRTFVLPIVFGNLSTIDAFRIIPNEFLSYRIFHEENAALITGQPSEIILDRLAPLVLALRKRPKVWIKPSRPLVADYQSHDKRELNEGKLILVGRGEVGKTSLVRRLASNEFSGDESKTQGINITTWQLSDRSGKLRLNVWDFGGQEIMHATHQFFLTERSLYLLVLNGREGGEDIDAEYWLKQIKAFGGDSPVIVVQNKISQHPFELDYRGLKSRYPQIEGFVKTDCMEAIGIPNLKELIQSVAAGMPEIRMPFPPDWFAVKEQLESLEGDILDLAGFRELCFRHGVVEESDRNALSWVLHCLGIALNYREDPRLRETSVLKPEWVTQGIYSILNATQLAEHEGELFLADLQKILPKGRYPTEKHLFLLELMRKFSLCFAFADEQNRYLIPELLSKEQPEEASRFLPRDCLNFEYHYSILPEGLIPRFIVRSHVLSQNQKRWRSGVILAYEDCMALVMAVTAEGRVIVRVIGNDAGSRRRLLAIIRYDLDRIHDEFRDRLEVRAMVPMRDHPEFALEYKKLVAFEQRGILIFPELVGRNVVQVSVNELLNGVDLEAQRKEVVDGMTTARTVFFSYSHKDESLCAELETSLKLLQRQGVISAWHDRKILPGTEWDGEIDHRLENATIILLLISADFIASDYCWDKEVKRAMERHEQREATVIPVILRACDWKSAPFAKLQGLPKDVKPITAWQDRDAAWTDVAAGIRAVVDSLK